MKDLLLLFLAFACGGFVGAIVAGFFSAASSGEEVDEFDGGYELSNTPPARTRIWSDAVNSERRK